MPIDKYQPCPCGSGKKIKFCCSADIVPELQKIQRMIDGDQRLACLEHVVHVLEKHPARPSLLSIKALLETELGDTQHAEETVRTFLETSPDNPVALAEQARLLAQEGKSLEAAEALQLALDAAGEALPSRVFTALGDVAMALLNDGRVSAARAHLLLHTSLGGQEDSSSAEVLMQINNAAQIPLLLRQDTRFATCADDAPYATAFNETMHLVSLARWRASLDGLEALADKHGREACIHRNIAILRGFLGRDELAGKAWRKYGVLIEPTSLDDAVEGEALAQLLDRADAAEPIDIVEGTFEIKDLDRTMEILLASSRTPKLPVDPASLASEGSPAPKAVFSLLDREMPESGNELTLDGAPEAWCDFYVFGRETDKPARITAMTSRPRMDDVQAALAELCGDAIGAEPSIEVVDNSDALEEALTWAWRLPEDTPREKRLELHTEKQRDAILNVWPTIPQTALDGKSAEQVQGDAKYRVRLLAAILLLEAQGQQNRWEADYDELRRKLELPTPEAIDPEAVDITTIPLARFARIDAAKLSTQLLIELFQYAAMMHAPTAMRNLGETLVDRDDLNEDISRANIYGILARSARDNAEAESLIVKAREAAVAQGQSPARWLLAELSLCIEQGNGERAQELMQRLQAKHQREEGVMQSLMGILSRYGLIEPQAGRGRAPDVGVAPAAAPSESGLWTPESVEAAAQTAGEEKPSGLWMPGMD